MSQYYSNIVRNLTPYVPGEQPQNRQYLKLNTNENPYPPSQLVTEAIKSQDIDLLKRYPDPDSRELTAAIAEFYQVNNEQVFVGNGSDEVLAHAFQAFFTEKDQLIFPAITYSFYPVYAQLYRINTKTLPLKGDFSIDVTAFCQTASGGTILPNPNAPTGKCLELTEIEKIIQAKQDQVVIIDEAYIDFGGRSAVELIDQYHNLLVIQTFSKSRSLAGLRIGFALGHADLIAGLNRIKNSFNSYPMDRIAINAGVAAMKDTAYFNDCCAKVVAARDWTDQQLKLLGFKTVESKANFILAKPKNNNAEAIYLALKEEGILVRYFKQSAVSDYLRISIDTQENMQQLISTLKKLDL